MDRQENTEMLNTILSTVLRYVREEARRKLPEQGIFRKFGISFCFPDDQYRGHLMIDFGSDREKRVANIAVYPTGSDRAVNNYLFFDNSQSVQAWLSAESSVEEFRKIALHLREKAEQMD